MPFPTPHTIWHRAYSADGDDGFGNAVESWADPVPRAIYGVGPGSNGTPGEDFEPGRIIADIPLLAFGPTSELGTVRARDRMVWLGEEFEVDGEPGNYDFGPFDWAPGIAIRLIRVEG